MRTLVDILIEAAICSSAPRKPGVVINGLSKEIREEVKKLTSKDFQHWVN